MDFLSIIVRRTGTPDLLCYKMPAYSRQVNDIHFPAIGLAGGRSCPDAIALPQFPLGYVLPEFIGITDSHTDHEIF